MNNCVNRENLSIHMFKGADYTPFSVFPIPGPDDA